MIKFSFNKKLTNTNNIKKLNDNEEKTFITSFELSDSINKSVEERTKINKSLVDGVTFKSVKGRDIKNSIFRSKEDGNIFLSNDLNEENLKPKFDRSVSSFRITKTSIKDFIMNDYDAQNSSKSVKEVERSTLENMSGLQRNPDIYTKLDKITCPKMIHGSRKRKVHEKMKGSNVKREEPIIVDGYAIIINGKYSGYFGKVHYVSDDKSAISVFINKLDRAVKFCSTSVKGISDEEYSDLLQMSVKTSKLDSPFQEKINNSDPIKEWLLPGLCVKIIDESYRNGQFKDLEVVIDDVYGIDECMCVTPDGTILSGLTSSMLSRVVPRKQKYARVLAGKYLLQIVKIQNIESMRATVLNEETEEEFEIDLHILCQICQ